MSFAGATCPCGDRKAPDTMICETCQTAFADQNEMAAMKSDYPSVERRNATIIILALARGRKRTRVQAQILGGL